MLRTKISFIEKSLYDCGNESIEEHESYSFIISEQNFTAQSDKKFEAHESIEQVFPSGARFPQKAVEPVRAKTT